MSYKELPLHNLFPFVQLVPLTVDERDALEASTGMVIYNAEDDVLEFYDGAAWVQLV